MNFNERRFKNLSGIEVDRLYGPQQVKEFAPDRKVEGCLKAEVYCSRTERLGAVYRE